MKWEKVDKMFLINIKNKFYCLKDIAKIDKIQ